MQIGLTDATTTQRAIRKAKRIYDILCVCVSVERETENKRECLLFVSCVKCRRGWQSVREREEPKKNEIRN